MNRELFDRSPRDYALMLVEEDMTSHEYLLIACLKYMGWDDIAEMLDINELSPRFFSD